MKYSISELLDYMVDDPNDYYFYYFKFPPDVAIDLRKDPRKYLDQINRIIALCPSPFELCRLRRLALEIVII